MKYPLFAACGALFLTSCAGVRVLDTQTAAVVTERPRAIYIQPFSIVGAEYTGSHGGGVGERAIRESLAPATFTEMLKEEIEKMAPTRVLRPNEVAVQGWLVSGSLDVVHAGSRSVRLFSPPLYPGAGRSYVKFHVRVRDLDHAGVASDDKNDSALSRRGDIIYEFDVAGGSHATGKFGSITAPAGGVADPFDYRNAAERIRTALETDPHRYGQRESPTLR